MGSESVPTMILITDWFLTFEYMTSVFHIHLSDVIGSLQRETNRSGRIKTMAAHQLLNA
jgi:hypothetical protein